MADEIVNRLIKENELLRADITCLRAENERLKIALQQSTSSAQDIGPTTTALPVPPSGTTDAHPMSTKRPAPDSPAIASPKRIQLDNSVQSTSSASDSPATASHERTQHDTSMQSTTSAADSPATASPERTQHDTSMQSTSPASDSPATASHERTQHDTSMARLGDLAVESVFPAAGFIRLYDGWVSRNEETIRRLRDGEILREERGWRPLTAGSRAEGVAVQPGWGHHRTDEDRMLLHGGDLAVGVDDPGQLPPGRVTLTYRGEGCPPTYTRLEVVDRDRLVAAINRKRFNNEFPAHMCVEEEGGRQWLLSRRLLDAMMFTHNPTVQGPAAAATPGSLTEYVTALVGTGPHPAMAAYTERPRTGWPSLTQLNYLITLCVLIVCVGPKEHPDTGRLFRVSTSLHEMYLITNLPLWIKQGYICFKYILKALLASSRQGDDDGRSRVGSYHLKTAFLWYLEEHPPQPEGSPYNLTLNLCRKLQQCLVNEFIPNYFIPECNLLEKVGEKERQEALRAVDKVLHDPLAAIIGSPLHPEEIFGSRHSRDDLLRCFRAVLSEQPTCGAAREALQWLLRDLDKHRVRRYRNQLQRDKGQVSGRSELVRLADCL